jgi:hypothetical protein
MRAVVVAAVAIAAAGACGKQASAPKAMAQREIVPVNQKLGNLQIEIGLPKDLKGGAKDATSLHYNEGAGDTLDVHIQVGTPIAMQNELNETSSLSMRVSRSDELPDGWSVTGAASDGSQTRNRRLIKVSDTQAVTCTALVYWGKGSAKNNEWVESFCKSLVVKPQ